MRTSDRSRIELRPNRVWRVPHHARKKAASDRIPRIHSQSPRAMNKRGSRSTSCKKWRMHNAGCRASLTILSHKIRWMSPESGFAPGCMP